MVVEDRCGGDIVKFFDGDLSGDGNDILMDLCGYEQTASHFLKVNCQNALEYLESLNISEHSFPLLHVKKYVF